MASTPKRDDESAPVDPEDEDRDTDSGDPTSLDIDVSITSKSPRVSRDTDHDVDAPNSRSVTARSRTEMAGKSAKEGEDKEDTLLSVDEDPREGAHDSVVSERSNQAVEELERRVVQLEARVKVIELQRGARPTEDRRWLFWVGLLLALALGWQFRGFFH